MNLEKTSVIGPSKKIYLKDHLSFSTCLKHEVEENYHSTLGVFVSLLTMKALVLLFLNMQEVSLSKEKSVTSSPSTMIIKSAFIYFVLDVIVVRMLRKTDGMFSSTSIIWKNKAQ